MSWRVKSALVAYHALVSFLQAGFLFHVSGAPVLYVWSATSLALFCVTGIPHTVPWLVIWMKRRLGSRHALFALLPLGFGAFLAWVAFSLHYYWTRTREFDPYLQVPPERLADTDLGGPDVLRVLAMGGSTTECGELAFEDRYPRVLERLLRERYPNIPIRVLNAGKPGYTTKHSLIAYVTDYHEWRPDVVVVMHAANDIYRSFSPPRHSLGRRYNRQYSHFYGAAGDAADPPSFERHLIQTLHLEFDPIWYDSIRTKLVDYEIGRYSSLREYEKYLGELLELTGRDGAERFVVSEPFLYKDGMSAAELEHLHMGYALCRDAGNWWKLRYPSARSLELAMRTFNTRAATLTRARGATAVDAEARVEKNLDHFVDDVHYTPRGAEDVARVVFEAIVNLGVVERRAAQRGLADAGGT